MQHTANLVNIIDQDYHVDHDLDRITRRFYEVFPDKFDFMAIVSSVARFENRFHISLQNQVQGIGLPQFDNTDSSGSQGRLLGINVFPIPTVFDGAESGYQHEIGHQWINFLRFAPLGQGVPHWPVSSMASGIMGWTGVGVQGSMFPCLLVPEPNGVRLMPRREEPVFSDFDLYLMGLLDSSSVTPGFVFSEQGSQASDNIISQCDGGIYEGEFEKVTIDQLIAQAGPRVPTASAAPKHFKIATIIASHDRLLNENEMALYSLFSRRAEAREELPVHVGFVHVTGKPFYMATRRLGSLDTLLSTTVEGPDSPAVPGLISSSLPGFRFWVRISDTRIGTAADTPCPGETVCVAGAIASRAEVFVRIVGPKGNGYLWPSVVKFNTTKTEVWIQQISTGVTKYYVLPALAHDTDSLPGLVDKTGFLP